MTEQHAALLAQVRSLPSLLREQTGPIEARARRVLTTPQIYGIRQIMLTGSGDSHAACLAAAPAIRAWTGLPVQPASSMEAARYVDLGCAPDPAHGLLAVVVSASGEGARPFEAGLRLQALGALTLAVTASPASRLATTTGRVLDMSVAPFPDAPGTRTYVASLLALLLLGIRIAEVRLQMTMDDANEVRARIAGLGDLVEASLPECEDAAAAFAARCVAHHVADCLGSGPCFGSAAFASAKLIEAVGIHATPQDAEEFNHLNFFAARPQEIPTLLFAPMRSAAASRLREVASTLAALERPTLVVTDDPDLAPASARLVLPCIDEALAPLLHAAPAALLAAEWAERTGALHFRGHAGLWRGASGAGVVRRSAILRRTGEEI